MKFTFTDKIQIRDERIRLYGKQNSNMKLSEKDRLIVTFTVNLTVVSNGFNFADIYFTKIYIEIYYSHKGEIILFNNSPNDFELENLLEFQTDGTLLIDRVEIDFRNKRISIA